MDLYTAAQMREAEQRTQAEYGIPLKALMQNAGEGLAQAALGLCPQPGARFGVFCGNGNNGGDGYVCAAELLRRGRDVTVWAIGADALPQGSLAADAAGEYIARGGAVVPVTSALTVQEIARDVLVDALLGTGLTRPVTGIYAHAIGLMNACSARVLACDLPSGVDADSGRIMGTAVRAAATVMMGFGKLAMALPPGNACFGRSELCDIGLPPALAAQFIPAQLG